MTRVRWTICALVFFAMTVNYLDRQIYSAIIPFFEDELRLGPMDLALLNASFILPYGIVMIFVGRFIDRVGLRRGLATTYSVWNLAMILHATIRSLTGFLGVRLMLGVGESGMYPSAVKTMSEWFPVRERSVAMGIFNAGANFGAIIAPLLGVALALRFGWRMCFVATGVLGVVWIFFWNAYYRSPATHPKVSASELAYIQQGDGDPAPALTYSQLFGMRPVYGLIIGKAFSDAPFWVYLTWLPKFLVDQFHVTPSFMAKAIAIAYVVASGASVAGGWASGALIRRGFAVGPARKIPMLVCALLVTPVILIGGLVDHAPIAGIPAVYWALGIVTLAMGAHQGFSSNLFTIISDTVPKNAIAMATGAINGFAMVGVVAMQFFVGRVVQLTSSYTWPFFLGGTLYLVALLILHLFIPKVEPYPTTRRAKIPLVVAGSLAILAGLVLLQYELSRPPYASLDEYLAVRPTQIHASSPPNRGPIAHVGWMDATWYRWRLADGKFKYELVKTDVEGHPYVEDKGAAASRYKGPTTALVPTLFSGNP